MTENEIDLDDEQRLAVESCEDSIMVLAGPGSGKTRVLSYRARHLLLGDPKSNALLLTFTNKAAAEMKERARGVAAVPGHRLFACTFHVFGMKILREHAQSLNLEASFEVLDRDESRALQQSVGDSSGDLSKSWSRRQLCQSSASPVVEAFGEKYEELKRARNVLDFDDLIAYSVELLERYPVLAKAYGQHYSHILIDEFQDTNAAQFKLLCLLASHAKTVGLFADDDQAIYGFAGADSRHIKQASRALSTCEYHLTTNYRCKKAIVSLANKLLDADPAMSQRRMKAAFAGGEYECKSHYSTSGEALWIFEDIKAQIATGKIQYESIAILVRSGFRAKVIASCLTNAGIPYSNWLGDRIDTEIRKVLRATLAVLRPVLTSQQQSRLAEYYDLSLNGDVETAAFLRANKKAPGVEELLEIHQSVSGMSVTQLLTHLQVSIGKVNPQRANQIPALIEEFRGFENCDSEFTVDHLLSELALGGSGGAPTAGGGVKLASLHRTKGLQWPCVYLVGMEEDSLPDFRAKSDQAIAEERRVCFVGVSRAESRLIFSRVTSLNSWPKSPSRFLSEMNVS